MKHTEDHSDARWLAHLLRLGLLPPGSISPQEQRPVRDLLRTRSPVVRHQTAPLLSLQKLVARTTGAAISGNRIKPWERDDVVGLFPAAERALAVTSHLAVRHGLADQMALLERTVQARVTLRPAFRQLLTVSGIGHIRALTMMRETGESGRFATGGNCAAYGRWVGSDQFSHGKRQGQGHTKNGHQSLARALVEAATFAVRDNPQITRYDQRKQANTNGVVAIKAVAHQLARACDEVRRDQVPCEAATALGGGT